MDTSSSIAVVIPTKDRIQLLETRAIQSVLSQDYAPEILVIVNDGEDFPTEVAESIYSKCPFKVVIIANERNPGLGGAVNTGLQYLTEREFNGYVALLDDDDTWDENHLSMNLRTSLDCGGDICISGLRLILNGTLAPRSLLNSVCVDDFLEGNPGWQGSNTFINIRAMNKVNGFSETIRAMHDRDFALRGILDGTLRFCFTNTWTANWFLDTDRNQLSGRGSEARRFAVRKFLETYGDLMSDEIKKAFNERLKNLFNIDLINDKTVGEIQ